MMNNSVTDPVSTPLMVDLSNDFFSWAQLMPIIPEIFLSLAALLILMVGVFAKQQNSPQSNQLVLALSLGALVVTMGLVIGSDWTTTKILNNMVVTDGFSALFKILILAGLIVSLLLADGWMKDNKFVRFEYSVLVLLAGIGMMLMVSANNLLSLYVALELQSLSLYVLAAIKRDNMPSAESGIKYFILGALSSGLLLFGISLVYGTMGTLDLDLIASTLMQNQNELLVGAVIGLVFIVTGLAFKISAVPFHMWTPDVYQGAPLAVTALFAIVPKVAAFGLLIRILYDGFAPSSADWSQILVVLSVASMAWGAFAALTQDNIKRLLAYSSIGNMGYALLGVLALSPEGIAATYLYLAIYMVMTAGTFAIVMSMRRNGQEVQSISDLAGLSKHNPMLAYMLAALMFSMSGIPPLAGFFGKLFVFQAAVEAGYFIVAVLGVLSSVVAAYYYIKIIKIMFFDDAALAFDAPDYFSRKIVLYASIASIVVFIFVPNFLLNKATQASQSLFSQQGVFVSGQGESRFPSEG
jgi:NADH-quinone oxidoreductase subunit N